MLVAVWRRAAGAVAVLCLTALLPAQPASAATATGHSVQWVFEGGPLYMLDQHVRVNRKAPTTYWAMQWALEPDPAGRDTGAYMGLQTGGTRPDGSTGEIGIFSMWTGDAGRPAPGGVCGAFGHEGSGWSCRIPFTLVEGRWYRYRTWMLETDASGTWWGAWLRDETSGAERYVGSIHVPFRGARIAPGAVIDFVEQFRPGTDWCARRPGFASGSFARPQTDPGEGGRLTRPAAARLLPDGACRHEHVADRSFGDRGPGVSISLGNR